MGFSKDLSKLENLSDFFGASVLYRHALFLLLSLFVIGITGYYFGTFDQAIHIPFLKKILDPTLYPNDPFFALRDTHYSYFWYIFYPFAQGGALELSLFFVHFSATYLSFVGIWRLTKTLFNDNLTTVLGVIAFSFPHIGFAAFPVFEFSLLNRTFALPFLLFSIDWYLKKQYLKSFVLLGLLGNIHALSVNFVLFMFGVDLLFRFWQERSSMERKLQLSLGMAGFILASLPVLLWKFGKSSFDFTFRPEWFDVISQSLMYTVFYPLSTSPTVLLLTLGGVSSFVLYLLATRHRHHSPPSHSVTHFFYAAIFLIGLEVLVSFWLPVTFLVQFQIVRIGIFTFIFAYLFFLHGLVKRMKSGTISPSQFVMQYASLFLAVTALIPLLVEVMMRIIPTRDRVIAGWFAVVTSLVACIILVWQTHIWRPGIYIFPQKTDWYDVQVWAKNNTPKDAMFLTPPDRWWFFEPDWRVFSERSTFVTLSEVLEFAFTPEYTPHWVSRFTIAAPGALEQFDGDVYKSLKLTKEAYASQSDKQLSVLALVNDIDYIVVEKPRRLPYPLVYENRTFSVFRVSPAFASVFRREVDK
ncbi:MAG: hypothetical protein HYV40_06540 [Candidatus Levybacteria bacterium]|nr:hypothetical protein [Candidatus Levybacteria bacterium]